MDKPCFELKGSLFTLTVLQLFDDDMSLLEAQLKERVAMAPGFFNHTPMVIDLNELAEEKQNFDFIALKELLSSLSIIPVGVKGAAKSVHAKLEAAGMVILAEAKKAKTSEQTPEPEPEIKSEDTAAPQNDTKDSATKAAEPIAASTQAATMVVRQTIRSGRQVYAPDGDLVIVGSVSAGAEILADGNIHVYGTLRGRALAGVQGNSSASIFCHSLQAELISIAGIYLLSEDIAENKIGKITQIFLEQERLQIELIP